MHVYSDASTTGYGFVAFRRVEKEDIVDVKFLFSKARVISKELAKSRHFNSVPKFEMVAAYAAGEWIHKFLQVCGEEYGEIFIWCESECCLKQIRSTSGRFKSSQIDFKRFMRIRKGKVGITYGRRIIRRITYQEV